MCWGCLSVGLSPSEPCKNGWSDRGALCIEDAGGPRKTPVAYSGPLRANTILCSFNTTSLLVYRCGFLSFFFSTSELSGHGNDLNQLGHIFTFDCYMKNLVWTPRASTPRAGGKNAFLGLTLNFDRTYLCNGTEYQQSEKGVNLHAPKSGELWPRKGWKLLASFCPPPKFSHWETLLVLPHGRYITDSRPTLARVM